MAQGNGDRPTELFLIGNDEPALQGIDEECARGFIPPVHRHDPASRPRPGAVRKARGLDDGKEKLLLAVDDRALVGPRNHLGRGCTAVRPAAAMSLPIDGALGFDSVCAAATVQSTTVAKMRESLRSSSKTGAADACQPACAGP